MDLLGLLGALYVIGHLGLGTEKSSKSFKQGSNTFLQIITNKTLAAGAFTDSPNVSTFGR